MSLAPFADLFAPPRSDPRGEELYARTFLVHPILSLECGWHLYGEEYERGVLMARIRERMRALGVPEAPELPDHLANVLPLADAMDEEERGLFVGAVVLPAVRRMVEGLKADRRVADMASDLSLKKKDRELLEAGAVRPSESPYLPALESLLAALEAVPGALEAEADLPARPAPGARTFCEACRGR